MKRMQTYICNSKDYLSNSFNYSDYLQVNCLRKHKMDVSQIDLLLQFVRDGYSRFVSRVFFT